MCETATNGGENEPPKVSKPVKRFGVAEWLSIAQLFALLVAGAWAAFLFVQFDSKDKELARHKSEIELRKLKAVPLSFDQDISIWPYQPEDKRRDKRLGVDYHYSVTNSTNQNIVVALVVVHALLLPSINVRTAQVVEIPPIRFGNGSTWKRVASKGYLAEGEEVKDGVVQSGEGVTITPTKGGGGGTGEMQPGEINWSSFSLIIGPSKSDYIAFIVEAFVRFEDNSTKWIRVDQYARLVPGENAGSPKAQAQATRKSDEK